MKNKEEQSCFDRVRREFDIKNSYALSEDDFKKITLFLNQAKLNQQHNEFPDFLFQGGFIEHFKITSSHQGRKGSDHMQRNKNFLRDCNQKIDEMAASNENVDFFDAYQYKGHSHENLIASFKKNWERHINSLNNASQSVGRQNAIFMVQYCDKALEMHGQPYDVSARELLPEYIETVNDYKLSRDKELLNYLHQYKDIVNYVIFVNMTETEIISIDNIEMRLKELQAWNFITRAAVFTLEFYGYVSSHVNDRNEAE